MSDVVVPSPDSREGKIAAAVEKHGETAAYCWEVYALDDKQRRKQIVARVHGLDFDEYKFGVKYGPGEYQRALKIDGNGRVPQILAEAFTVDARINAPEPSATLAAVSRQDEPPAWAKSMIERMDRIERPATPPPPTNTPESVGVKDLIALFTPMIQAAATPKDTGITLKDVLPLITQRSTAGELAELFKVAKDLAPQGGGDEGLGQMGVAFAQLLSDARQQPAPQQQRPMQRPQAPALPPGGGSPPAAAAASPEPNRPLPFPGAANVARDLRQFLPHLADAKVLADNLPKLVRALEEEITNAGGVPEDVATRYGDAKRFAAAFVAYAPDYANHAAVLDAISGAFFEQYEDDGGLNDGGASTAGG